MLLNSSARGNRLQTSSTHKVFHRQALLLSHVRPSQKLHTRCQCSVEAPSTLQPLQRNGPPEVNSDARASWKQAESFRKWVARCHSTAEKPFAPAPSIVVTFIHNLLRNPPPPTPETQQAISDCLCPLLNSMELENKHAYHQRSYEAHHEQMMRIRRRQDKKPPQLSKKMRLKGPTSDPASALKVLLALSDGVAAQPQLFGALLVAPAFKEGSKRLMLHAAAQEETYEHPAKLGPLAAAQERFRICAQDFWNELEELDMLEIGSDGLSNVLHAAAEIHANTGKEWPPELVLNLLRAIHVKAEFMSAAAVARAFRGCARLGVEIERVPPGLRQALDRVAGELQDAEAESVVGALLKLGVPTSSAPQVLQESMMAARDENGAAA